VTAALQRVAVHAAVLDGTGERVLVRDGVLPWTVLAHGESPAAALGRLLGPATAAGDLLAVVDGRRAADGVDLHTVHLVVAAEAPRDVNGGQWVPRGTSWPLVEDGLVAVGAAELARLRPPNDPDAPVLRQRLACYGVVVHEDRLLLTRLSSNTPSPGRWTLPGGGVDHGEHPLLAVVREVHEETGMDVEVDRLAEVGAEHFTGRSPRGVLEDFHAVRLLVTARALHVREPEVLDVGGSTDLARWVPFDEASSIGLVGVAQRGLDIAMSDGMRA
jgi:8-oxo-dGTP diphosphatase